MSELSLGLSTASAGGTPLEARRQFFDVSVVKLVVMSIVTFGVYEIYWFYKHWQALRERGEDVLPLPRAIFAVLFAYALFQETVASGRNAAVKVATRPGVNALLFFTLQLAWRLPDPFWLLGFTTVLPLIPMQQDVRRIHSAMGLDPTVNDGLSGWNVAAIVAGVIWMILVIVGLMMPAA